MIRPFLPKFRPKTLHQFYHTLSKFRGAVQEEYLLSIFSEKTQELFKILLIHRLLSYEDDWRRRRTVQIEAVDENSYFEKTTFQFYFPIKNIIDTLKELREILDDYTINASMSPGDEFKEKIIRDRIFLNKIFAEISEKEEKLIGKKIHIYLPMDFYPKSTLMHFDLRNSKGHALALLARIESTRLILPALIRPELEEKGLGNFFRQCESTLSAIVFQAPDDLQAAMKNIKGLCRGCEQKELWVNNFRFKISNDYHNCETENYRVFIINSLKRYLGRDFLQPSHIEKIYSISKSVDELGKKLRAASVIQDENYLLNPCINVLMLALDYFKTAKIHSPRIENNYNSLLEKYFDDCIKYLKEFLAIDTSLLKDFYERLMFYTYYYYAFVPTEIHVNEFILLKTEQLLAQKYERPLINKIKDLYDFHRITPKCEQLYHLKIVTDLSLHYEVKCHEPSELEILSKESFLKISGKERTKIVKIEDLFGYSSSDTRHTKHFYTTKTWEEVVNICMNLDIIEPRSFYLGIKYKIDSVIVWTHRVGFFSALFSLLFLLFVYEPPRLSNNYTGTGVIAIIPLIVPVVAIVLSFRTKEIVVAEWSRFYKIAILLILGFILFYFFIQSIDPDTYNPDSYKKFIELVFIKLLQLKII